MFGKTQPYNITTMKSLLTPVLGLALASSAFAGTSYSSKNAAPVAPAPAAEDTLGFTLTAGYDTHYIYRGVEVAENLVSVALNGSIALTEQASLDLGAWAATSADDSFRGNQSYQQLDLYAALMFDLNAFKVGVKYQHYFFEGDASDISGIDEIGVVASTNLGFADLNGGAYYDEAADGFYFELGLSKSIALTDRVSLVPGALVSYAHDYYGIDGFNHVKVGVALPIKLTNNATLTPYVAANLPIDALDDAGADDQVYGGVSLSVSF